MIFDELEDGDYRIYGGAIEARQGDGYIAALVVDRIRNKLWAKREVFRDDALACGHRWPCASAALSYAMGKGRQVVSTAQSEALR